MKYLLPFFFFIVSTRLEAQICTGGLGDPIVHISFGSGADIGPALAQGITNLRYVTDHCPSDGQYTIVHANPPCFGNTWLNISSDHTGDPNGYFMLINASYAPSDFYVQKVDGLCESTTYQFALWAMNVVSIGGEILPNITFRLEKTDGTILQTLNTNDIPTAFPAKWTQYGFIFATPPGVSSVVIRMTNNAPGGNGNDLAIDDITFRPSGPAIGMSIDNFPGDTAAVCATDLATLHFLADVENCYATTVYQWQQSTDSGASWQDIPGATGLTYSRAPTAAGLYLYRLTVAQSVGNLAISSCRVASTPITVIVNKIPVPGVTISSGSETLCEGAPAVFTAVPADGGNAPVYRWQLNGADVGTNSDIFTSSSLANGDLLQCLMTSNAVCVILPDVQSNKVTAKVIPKVISSVRILASATTICSDSLVVFTALAVNGGIRPTYQWLVNGQNAGTNSFAFTSKELKDGDVIDCRMTSTLQCSTPVLANAPVMMTVYPVPVITLTPDTIIAAGTTIHFSPSITGDRLDYLWSPVTGLDDPHSPDPVGLPAVTTLYQLEVTTDKGCRAVARENVGVFYYLAMPNAFTPNGDGVNDLFRIPASVPVNILRFSVYNRTGIMVFTTANRSEGWDGRWNNKPQPAGTYVWFVQYKELRTGKTLTSKGTVGLIR